jgi:hypothetical protein
MRGHLTISLGRKAAITSVVVKIEWAKAGPFSSWAACIMSAVTAAVASRTSVTW